ncbi:hypothetical protein [Morganella morganii]|uniref:hypothetical protein n=1 Tax=Morganella morganii TaxID=582 RepID=UPI001419BCB9|nr:hypothetical protein [Morganella morganii]ELB1545324.1 hypothetical protein [Morganella morganii]NIH20562.1 hypothetical protein [Morganella morganii]HDS6844445.1 hypothetical protein [Morganella morganii subsp. morganii]HDU8311196.1 hypothetical protein [Morganella morganii subsp. sibonii]
MKWKNKRYRQISRIKAKIVTIQPEQKSSVRREKIQQKRLMSAGKQQGSENSNGMQLNPLIASRRDCFCPQTDILSEEAHPVHILTMTSCHSHHP